MKLVTAVVSPRALEDLKAAVRLTGARAMTISEAHGVGHGAARPGPAPGADDEVEFVPRFRVEIPVDDVDAEHVAEVIARWVATSDVADGRVWVTSVEEALPMSAVEPVVAAVA
jgi:nitrogen regulatory protein PII